jgi:hypothetical protein
MGFTMPNQAPQIQYPKQGAADVPTDTCAWVRGGTIWDPAAAPPFRFEHAGGSIPATYEPLGGTQWRSPMGMETIPVARIRPHDPLPARTPIALVYGNQTLARFGTGDGPAKPTLPPTEAPQPPGPPWAMPGDATSIRSIGLAFADGVFVVDTGGDTHLVIGPVTIGVGASAGEKIRVRDAQLKTVFETVV